MAQSPKKKSTEVAKKESTEVTVADIDFEGDSGVGSENIGLDDVIIPRIGILQALSPQVNKRDPAFIEGAEQGIIFNAALSKLYGTEIDIIPVAYKTFYIEWVPRKKGGGLVEGDHDPSILESCEKDEDGTYITPDGNELIVTPTWFCLVLHEDGEYERAVLSMSGTKAKAARQINTFVKDLMIRTKDGRRFNPASFYSAFRLTSVPNENEQGSWYEFKVTPLGATTDLKGGVEAYVSARDFHKQVESGEVKAEAAQDAPADSGSGVDHDKF